MSHYHSLHICKIIGTGPFSFIESIYSFVQNMILLLENDRIYFGEILTPLSVFLCFLSGIKLWLYNSIRS